MVRNASLFCQILEFFPRGRFQALVREYGVERSAKGFTSWSQFVSMLFCQLAQMKSLREICNGLTSCMGKVRHLGIQEAPCRSTLAYANEHRHWAFFEALFKDMLSYCIQQAPQKKFRFKNKLLSLDATVIDLCLAMFPWATFRQTKGAVKLHMLLDHDGYLPVYAYISEGSVHEIQIARTIDLPADSIVAMDRGFTDFSLYGTWTDRKVWFVTRLKDNAVYETLENREVPKRGVILSDELILLTGVKARETCPHTLRRITVWDEVNQCPIVLLTNHLRFAASTIAAIYKDRWQIEIFFKTLKQNLKVKTFVGTSENALKIQIWTALIALLIVKHLQHRARFNWSLSNLVAMLRLNLFTYRLLNDWLDDPWETPPLGPSSGQQDLPFPGSGQHVVKS